ncbi:hypothetical protein FSP39_021847 [Pinctada imbricata]|uniref:Uncharacterized protein n=1 Tax=Pinctada imbricata TaxID=66713 RepID=A0AA88XTX4_PINIB|nr:hypothetical protein FSP39_021847 [Pinctada imbricata]
MWTPKFIDLGANLAPENFKEFSSLILHFKNGFYVMYMSVNCQYGKLVQQPQRQDTSESLSTPRPQTPLGRPKSADSDSFKLGKDGNKFLKKKPEARESSLVKPRSPVSRSPKSTSPVPDRRNDKQKISKQKHKPETRESDKKVSPYTLRSSLKYSTDVVLSSGEESLAEFISGLDKKGLKNKEKKGQQQRHEIGKRRSPSPSTLQRSPSPDTKPPTVRRTPSPSTPRRSQSPIFRRRSPSPQYRRSRSRSSGDSDFGDSLQSEVIQEIREEDSVSSEDAFGVKLMDVDSLEPVLIASPSKSSVSKEKKKGKEKQKKAGISFKKEEKVLEKKKKKDLKRRKSDNDDIFSSFGIQTVDDLLGGISGLDEKVEIASLASEASEIKTQSESEEIHT